MSARSTDTAKQSAYFRLIKLPTMKSSADLSSPRIAWDHFADPESGLSAKKKLQLRILVFVAHPDDETIGASSLMSRVADVSVIFLTDGAPTTLASGHPTQKARVKITRKCGGTKPLRQRLW